MSKIRGVGPTVGHPYFRQELGSAVRGVAQADTITANDAEDAIPMYEATVDAAFSVSASTGCTEKQTTHLHAMSELGPEPQKAAVVAAKVDRTSPQVATTRAELIAIGLLYTPEHGYAAPTVPHFDEFMLHAIPDLVIPQKRPRAKK